MKAEFTTIRGETETWRELPDVDLPDGFRPFMVKWPSTGDQHKDTFGPWPFEIQCWRPHEA